MSRRPPGRAVDAGRLAGPEMGTPLRFKCASRTEVAQALRLREQVYSEDAAYVPADNLDPVATHLVAVAPDGRVVATLRFVASHHRPFDFEQHVSLSSLGGDARVAMIGRFCVSPAYRALPTGLWVQIGMLKLMYLVARSACATHVVMYTFDHLLTFYREASFRMLPDCPTFYHSGYSRVMHLMYLDLAEFERKQLGSSGRLSKAFDGIDAAP